MEGTHTQGLWHSALMHKPLRADRSRLFRLLAVGVLGWAGGVSAVEQVVFTADHLRGDGWQARAVQLKLDLGRDSGTLQVATLSMPSPVGELQDLRIHCARLRFDAAVLDCPKAQFHLKGSLLQTPDFTGGFRYQMTSQALRFHFDNLPVGETRVKLTASLEDSTWLAELEAPGLSLSSDDGKFASDKLALKLSAHARPQAAGRWDFSLKLNAQSGQAYVEPVFLDLAQAPLRAEFSGHWQPALKQLVLDTLRIEQAKLLRASGSLGLDFTGPKPLQSMQLQVDEAVLPGAYASYLQPFLIGTVLDSLETQGRISGRVGLADGKPVLVQLKLDEVHLDDKKKRFALYGLGGSVNWSAVAGTDKVTQLGWEGGNAYRLDLGAAKLRLLAAGGQVRLLEPLRLPVLDGRLDVRRFELVDAGAPAMRMVFDGELLPVGMERLSRALDWPVFAGTLSGTLPTLEYHDGNLTVGGTLAANVFDGRVEIDKLRLEQPFGNLPRLSADMTMRRIDLKSATSAFSFGRIEGRLDGDVKNLRLLKWKPVAFDGRLYTTPGDDSRHRISQRAIENIANLGGSGAAGVLSRGFLRFFEDFAYDRIALGCQLRDGACLMTGLEPHRSGGYYIVKGKLLPRIDVIGYATRVNWDGFVEQLKSATKSEGPVIK
jgi:hypothetical protein